MEPFSFLNRGPRGDGPQYLEDLATGYWLSEVLFTAVELAVFSLLDPGGRTADGVAGELELDSRGVERFLEALCALGLVVRRGETFYNAEIASTYLVKAKEGYQGDSILWRKHLSPAWRDLKRSLQAGGRVNFNPDREEPVQFMDRIRRFIRAMDDMARTKVQEIIPVLGDLPPGGEILDVGAGSGAVSAGFLDRFPGMKATLIDLPEVLKVAGELLRQRGLASRTTFCPANILEPWPVSEKRFDLVLLSNLIHAFSENEARRVLSRAGASLKPDGLLLVHDFFKEHCPVKAALFDLNMFINTYNGKVFAGEWVREQLQAENLSVTPLIPLGSDTGVIMASKNEKKGKVGSGLTF